MGTTKSEIFTIEQNKLATLFKVLGHPARIAIIQHIIKQNACICTDLVDVLGLAQATISQHLKELKSIEKYWNYPRSYRREIGLLLY